MYRLAIIIASDSGYQGIRADRSGPYIKGCMEEKGYDVVSLQVLPDEQEVLAQHMKTICEEKHADLILTSGGTGLSQRDCTPEATLQVIEKQAVGIPEAMRAYSMQFTKRAMFSRAIAGVCKKTLIINLPGSPKAVQECLDAILDELPHALGILIGNEGECGRT